MLTTREKIHACALRSELAGTVLLLAACSGFAVGFAAVACIVHTIDGWQAFAGAAAGATIIAAALAWRATRLRQRLGALEKFL